MKKGIITLVILSLGWTIIFAQLNESDTLRYQFRANLTGTYQQGNVSLMVIRSKVDFTFADKNNWAFKSQNSSLYQAFAVKADNDIFSRNYLYFKPQNTIYPFGIAYISTNYRRKIESRLFAGAGATWQLIRSKSSVLKVSTNAVYEITQFNGNTFNYAEFNGNDKNKVWRGTLYMAGWHNLLEKHLRLYYDAYWQPAFENSHDYRIEYDIGLDFPVWKGFSFNILYTYKHENLVITKIKPGDKILTFGLAYNFKQNHH
ncbi:MAG: DUF481 domain-containing protein [Saprospiraceae bacterium]|nr:DUF481 domain-containing protein [Saprospiraceae bacterium]